MRRFGHSFLITFLVALLVQPVWPQDGRESLTGHVLPSPGERELPQASTISVYLHLVGTGFNKAETVREGGRFDFVGIPRGRYELSVKCPGYVETTRELIVYRSLAGEPALIYIPLGAREDGEGTPISKKTVDVDLLGVPEKALKEMEKASKASEQGKSEQAIKSLLKAIEIYPDFPQAYSNLGVQYLKLSRNDEASTAFTKSIELSPGDNPVAYRNLGLLHLQKREYPKAIENLRQSLLQDPGNGSAALALGRAYFDSGNAEAAIDAFEEAVRLEPQNPLAHFALGYACFQVGRMDQAATELKLFLASESEGSRADLARQLLGKIPPG